MHFKISFKRTSLSLRTFDESLMALLEAKHPKVTI